MKKTMPVTQQEMKEFVLRLKNVTMKTRSNVMETLDNASANLGFDDLSKKIAQDLMPHLFPRERSVGILESVLLVEKKDTVEPIDIFNLLFLCQTEPAVRITWQLWFDEELPEPTDWMRAHNKANRQPL